LKNSLVSQILSELADYTELEDEQPYRARAYRRAAQVIESLQEDIEDVAREGRLQELPGVGENIEKKIQEILRTGKLEALEKLKQRIPVDVNSLIRVEGIGPKTAKLLYERLKIRNLDDLESAVKEGKLQNIKGLGIKSQKLLLERIEAARARSNRILLVQAQELAERVSKELSEISSVKNFAIAGSFRRYKETVGDFDVLVLSDNPEQFMADFTKWNEVNEVILSGEQKTSVKIENNFQIDVRVVRENSWGAALLYFTGSKPHNIELRTLAIKKGLRLNEYGLFTSEGKQVAGATEEGIYSYLGLDFILPELRENRGEIQCAQNHTLPKPIDLGEIKGDLQMHTNWSDGTADIQSMAEKARALGYEYIAITDHAGSLKIANALDSERIRNQSKEIERLNEKFEKEGFGLHILHGAEVNIKSDGTMDLPNAELKQFDLVLGSIHSGFGDDKDKMTRRVLSAMDNEHVDVIAHPTGRILLERSSYSLDFQKVIEKSLETDTILEMDVHPNRFDLSDEMAYQAIKSRCKISVDTDSHSPRELEYMKIGISQARRAWAEKKDVLNTLSYKELLRFIGK
jgi:DNA polymerase (family 10)